MFVWDIKYAMARFINARSYLETEELKYMYSQWRDRNAKELGEVFIKLLSEMKNKSQLDVTYYFIVLLIG